MPTSYERLSIVVDPTVAAALDRAAARRGRCKSRAGLARELLLAGDRAEEGEAAEARETERRRVEQAERTIAWAKSGYPGLDLTVLASGEAWARE